MTWGVGRGRPQPLVLTNGGFDIQVPHTPYFNIHKFYHFKILPMQTKLKSHK